MARRILHVGKFYPPHMGGMEVFLSDLIDAQRAAGLEVAAVVHGNPLPDDPEWLIRVPVQAQIIFAPIALGFPAALNAAIRRFKPQVLHLHMPNNAAFWALVVPAARDIPWVVHWHSDVVPSRIKGLVAAAYRLYQPFETAVLDRAEHVIATSPPYLLASGPLLPWREKCTVVPLGLQIPKRFALVPPAMGVSTPSTSSMDWQPHRLRLLSIGRLTYYKGFETLVRAVSSLPQVELLIAGDGELRPQLQKLIGDCTPNGQSPNVRLLGLVSEPHKQALLAECDVFCMASRERTEAFGIVLLEAMLHGRPCLVSDLAGSGMPWVVAQSGCGRTVPLDDVTQWQQAITALQNDPVARTTMGAAGRTALHARFSIKACAAAVAMVYEHTAPEDVPALPGESVLVVIPARDEATTVSQVVSALRAAGWSDVLVIDDQSSDETAALARAAGARVLRPVLPVGAWGGMQTGLRYALAHGYAGVVTMDADGQHEVSQVGALYSQRFKADLVIGAFPERASRARQLAWTWFRKTAGFDLRDLTSGFRYYNGAALRVLASHEATLLDYQDLGALLMARRAGLRIAEVPVEMNLRTAGVSRIFNSWFSVARYMALTTLLCLARWEVPRRDRSG